MRKDFLGIDISSKLNCEGRSALLRGISIVALASACAASATRPSIAEETNGFWEPGTLGGLYSTAYGVNADGTVW
ncbi:hypothetical protein J2Z17_003375 [Rhizobium halophytocola]|uniref:Uncharacterized protein n=1 Tax=Rhizobium halophytocola TaxID=735519 RepID=A0ABS4E1Y9_9HYPH|nr:hypothetical protein [Rhizobium halophytocola]